MNHNSQTYLELSVRVSPEITEWVSNVLFELGASGIQELDNKLLAFFNNVQPVETLSKTVSDALNVLRQRMNIDIVLDFEIQEHRVTDWRSEWKKNLVPVAVGHSLLIKPSWCERPVNAPNHIIELDPEMAFGFGTHATTFLILEALEHWVRPDCRVLDVGCGTGILSIAALKIGAGSAVAFDIDPVAAQIARRNAAKNDVIQRMNVFTGTLNTVSGQNFDMIVANVNRSQLVPLLFSFSKCLAPNGVCLLSGILNKEQALFSRACRESGLRILHVKSRDEWLMFETVKT